ncbi:NADP-dependent oxidoreductase [Ascidiaceihabitans sp.]|uniref:NADP-dependent oxidoreductase n=1 Tax=Ascidiaceihabitans sp. TaxID=1872644 RepID=UPI003297BCC4
MTDQMQRIALAGRPSGAPQPEHFSFETAEVPTPGPGQILVRNHYMSLDPYMRGRMDDGKSYAAPVPIGGTMEGGGVGEVIASNSEAFKPGDIAFGMFGWATHAVADAQMCRKINPDHGPITASLGVLGMPGFTGWYGLMEYGRPKAGETLVVAAATGPVGSMVGQVAKSLGLKTIGIAGGPDKCKMAVETFGFDVCLDHRAYDDAKSMRAAIKEAAGGGVDIYFENVGGKVLEAVMPLMKPHGRIPICGMISWYNDGGLGAGASSKLSAPAMWRTILVNFLSVNGFIISNHWNDFPKFLGEIGPKVASGDIKVVEDIAEGLENAPKAFMGLLEGKNVGKQIVKVI